MLHFTNRLPHGAEAESDVAKELRERERTTALKLKERGVWSHVWHVVGQNSFYTVFNAESNDMLHQVVSSLALFPYFDISIEPLWEMHASG
jgi:muconolactone D-isomerase